ncbi:MAG TPA: tetratricopeptide repeat protein [Terriglobia bacterium]|nr:tetratricopeptide repeat protein [Terriglobia bacterium]
MKARRVWAVPLALAGGLVLAGSGLAVPTPQTRKEPPDCVEGDYALAQHQSDLAIAQFQKCIAENPPSAEALSNLGVAFAQKGDFDHAIQAYTQALALDSNDANIFLNLGLAYLKSKHVKEAAKEFARSLMIKPGNPKALELLALCHYQMDQFELAAYEAKLVHDALPDEASGTLLYGLACLHLGLYKQAATLIYSAVSTNKSAEGFKALGEALLGVKAYRNALEAFLQAEKTDPNLPGIHSDLGISYAGLAQTEQATAEFKKQLALDPDDFNANYYLGRLDRLAGNDADAQRFLAKANQLRPGDSSVAYEYAVLAMQAGDYAKAASLLEGILQKVPGYLDARVLLAQAYFRLHRTQDGKRESALVNAMKREAQAQVDAEGQEVKKAAEQARSLADKHH